MNANNIESKFAEMGARIKVREIASRWRRGKRTRRSKSAAWENAKYYWVLARA